jgi:hypothetical protein
VRGEEAAALEVGDRGGLEEPLHVWLGEVVGIAAWASVSAATTGLASPTSAHTD